MEGGNTKKRKAKKGGVQVTSKGRARILSTFNNTIVTITNLLGDTIAWASAGSVGFKGSKKSTPYAATRAAFECAEKAMSRGVQEVLVQVKGLGMTRKSAIRALIERKLKITGIQDLTPIQHNGCRAPSKKHA